MHLGSIFPYDNQKVKNIPILSKLSKIIQRILFPFAYDSSQANECNQMKLLKFEFSVYISTILHPQFHTKQTFFHDYSWPIKL